MQRIWVRYQLPLQIGYARTIHMAQGCSFDRPHHVDCVDVFFKGGYVPCSLIYTAVSRARSVDQLHFERDRNGRIFNPDRAVPTENALKYHLEVTRSYRPMEASVAAVRDGQQR